MRGVLDRRIADGTADFTQGPAMTRAQTIGAIEGGMRLVRNWKAKGYTLLATGEMGIGNTTTSSAVAAALLGQPVERMTGRGAGLSDAGLARKIDAIRRGIAVNRPKADDPLDILAKLGGLDIAGLCGMFLGGAIHGIPIVMDGFISGVAALCAARLCPNAGKAAFASHASSEPAARLVLEALDKQPLITADMHLGEGTGRRSRPFRCGIWRWPSIKTAIRLRRAASSRIPRNADAGCRRFGQPARARLQSGSPCKAACRAFTWRPCVSGTRRARSAWRAIGPCGGKSGLKRWNARCIWKNWTCRRAGTALLEDMGNLAANELYDADGAKADAVSAILRGADRLRAQCAHLIIVSNEVFRGGADYAGDTDAYLLALAQINNALAARAENVCRVVCGIPKWVKGGNGLGRA